MPLAPTAGITLPPSGDGVRLVSLLVASTHPAGRGTGFIAPRHDPAWRVPGVSLLSWSHAPRPGLVAAPRRAQGPGGEAARAGARAQDGRRCDRGAGRARPGVADGDAAARPHPPCWRAFARLPDGRARGGAGD